MLSYFLSPEFTVSDKLVQVLYLLSGFFCMYSGIRSWTKKDSENPFATGFFWFTLGIIVAFGMWLTDFQVGILVCLICIPAAFNRVKRNTLQTPTQEEQRANFNKIGMKIFIPALSSAVFALGIAIFLKGWNSLIGSLLATIFGITLLLIWNKENKIMTFMEEGRRFLGLCRHPGIHHRYGAVHHHHGQRFRCHHRYDRWCRCSFRYEPGCRPAVHDFPGADHRLLWHPADPNGCQLQHRSRHLSGNRKQIFHHQNAGRTCHPDVHLPGFLYVHRSKITRIPCCTNCYRAASTRHQPLSLLSDICFSAKGSSLFTFCR